MSNRPGAGVGVLDGKMGVMASLRVSAPVYAIPPPLAIGQYPVHAIKSDKDNLPEQWNNNDWEITNAKVVGNTMTATMTEKIDNLKVGRAYVIVSKNNGMDVSVQYSEAFFIVPPSYQGDL